MNVVKILLILGLGYFALTQKNEKTKNMLLVVTGLLAFCMFSLEGFTDITFTSDGDSVVTGGTVTGDNGGTYTFTPNFAIVSASPTWTCATGKTPGPLSQTDLAGARIAGDLSDGPLTAANIDSVFPCVDDATTGSSCPSTAPDPHKCGTGKKYKSTITAANTYTGPVGSADYKVKCCETDTTDTTGGTCTADKCNTWDWFGMADHGEKCEDGLGWDTYCEE
jgi:hypothetical protein